MAGGARHTLVPAPKEMAAAAPKQRGCSSGIRSNGVVAVVGAHVAAAVVRSALVDIQALLAIPRCGVPPRTTVARVVPARQVLALARWRAKRFRAPVLLARRILHASRPLPHLMARGSRRRRSSTSGGSSMGRASAVPCRRKARSHKGMRHPCIQTNLPAQTKTAMPRSSVPGGSEYRPPSPLPLSASDRPVLPHLRSSQRRLRYAPIESRPHTNGGSQCHDGRARSSARVGSSPGVLTQIVCWPLQGYSAFRSASPGSISSPSMHSLISRHATAPEAQHDGITSPRTHMGQLRALP